MWYLIKEIKANNGFHNMAVDEWLFDQCHKEKCGFIRLYQWERPTFSIGAMQKSNRVLDMDYLQSNEIPFVRRPTGGKTVYHYNEITYSVNASVEMFSGGNNLDQSYLFIANILVQALRKVNIPATLADERDLALAKSNQPCFSFPTLNEIEVNKKKIIGSAQKRDKWAFLQHGSLPITMNYQEYGLATHCSDELIRNKMVTLSELGIHDLDRVRDAIIESFQVSLKSDFVNYDFGEPDHNEISYKENIFKSSEWNNSR
jgi:lipoate-protein ligase A